MFPMAGHGNKKLPIPPNVQVHTVDFNKPTFVKKLLLRHGGIVAKWFVIEFIKSPHRFKYISQFRWNFKRLLGLLNNAVEHKKYLTENQLTIVNPRPIFYSYWFNEWATILIFLKDLGLDFKINTRVHLYDFEEEFSARKYLPFRYYEMGKVSKIFSISEYANKNIKKKFKSTSILISKLGVNSKGNNPLPTQNGVYTIVSCSNLSWYKRPLLLVDLMKQFKVKINWIHLGDGQMKNDFLKATEDLPSNVNFTFKSSIPNSEVLAFYNTNPLDLLLNVSAFEGIPVSMMEAISFGIPVVGCNMCGMPEIITTQTGVLLELNFDPEEAAKAIENFIQNQSRDSDFRKGVKGFWASNFNAYKNYNHFVNDLTKSH